MFDNHMNLITAVASFPFIILGGGEKNQWKGSSKLADLWWTGNSGYHVRG